MNEQKLEELYHIHAHCGGSLSFHHKEGMKTFFLCGECGASVNCCLCPSYNQYVMSGRIRVSPTEYYQIKNGLRTKK